MFHDKCLANIVVYGLFGLLCFMINVSPVSDYSQQEAHHRVSPTTAARLRVAAIVVSWCSVLFSFSTGVAALGRYWPIGAFSFLLSPPVGRWGYL